MVEHPRPSVALPPELGSLQALTELNLTFCEGLTSLPARLGWLQKLERLNLAACNGLTSLPPELAGLQSLRHLNLGQCTGLTSLPDLSGIKKLYVDSNIPETLKPWEEGGRKAFALG